MLLDRAVPVCRQEPLQVVDALEERSAHVRIRNALSGGGRVDDLLRGMMVRAGSARSTDVTKRSVVDGTRGKRAIYRRNEAERSGWYAREARDLPL